MIVVKMQGGLGNQMFQYALGRALSLRTGTPVHFDRSWYKQVPSDCTPRVFELDVFSLPLLFVEKQDIPWECRPAQNNYELFCGKVLRRATVLKKLFGLPASRFLFDDGQGVRQDILGIRRGQNVYLDGYWQSEKYFQDADPVIREDFIFLEAHDSQNGILLEQIAADPAAGGLPVSVHIRRGDYSSNSQVNAVHGLLPLSFYETAMAEIEKRFAQISYYVFSDDLSWCREHMRFNGRVTFVDINTDKPSWMDMRLMSACRHHIIANSSFSWWAAWLNAHKDKMVIAPKQWLANSGSIEKDHLPDGWIRV